MPIEPGILVTAFLAGLLGSGHCFGMCGGIATSLGALSAGRTARRALFAPAFQFNLGRMLGYALIGALAGGVIGATAQIMSFQSHGRWLRALTALMVLVIGLRFLTGWRGLDFIEKGGAGLWKRVLPLATRANQRRDWIGRTALGLCWGLLPCGLVYTVLMTAASTGNAASGALTMLAFGAGTAPAMLGMTVAAPSLAAFLGDSTVRRIVGLSLVVLAAWILVPVILGSGQHGHG